ncbi:hypothetical protein PR048_009943 [Dryococelus australis]|uniref:Uncharacterized protein n=1 Tax=Dryococelus australis TaxID=614101 RepID=A0ABQ9I1C5_9NEOP|nr:hypothetical protein PR048_009943 [Dryococelus australis]
MCVLKPDPFKNYEVANMMPHHAVLKEAIFDVFITTSTGVSLNDLLSTGTKLERDIGDIILNFPTMPVSTTDICKMYHQIQIHPDDLDGIVTGVNSVEEAFQLKVELVSPLEQGGFELRKWSCNNTTGEVLRSFDRNTSPAIKVLGVTCVP